MEPASYNPKFVIGVLDTADRAESVVSRLISNGFGTERISVLFPDPNATVEFAREKNTKAPQGAAVGAATGGVLGGTLGALVGVGLLAIPGLGPLLAAGPIVASLSGGAVGATVGGLTGALVGWGVPEAEARRYEDRLKEGKIVVAVHTADGDERKVARQLFEDLGASDVSTVQDDVSRSGSVVA